MSPFTSLRMRLTVLCTGLFGLALAMVAGVVLLTVGDNARRQVRAELAAGGAVFDRLWALKARQLSEGAGLLSRDSGFREAVASSDAPTIESTLRTLQARLKPDRAFLVDMDGAIIGAPDLSETEAAALWSVLNSGAGSGVLRLGVVPYQAVAEPVMAPHLTGWVVFADRLDRTEMKSLEQLASISLTATVLSRPDSGAWRSTDPGEKPDPRLVGFVEDAGTGVRPLDTDQGQALALAHPLKVMGETSRAVLVLRYPLKLALAPYSSLTLVLALVALAGLGVLIAGSWLLARSITRPVSALDLAAGRLRDGEDAHVEPATLDEIGRLAESFNAMASGIRDREGRIAAMALTDQETQLPNRRALEASIARSGPEGLFIVAFGVDRFLQLRAAVGYRLAATVLQRLAGRLGELAPDVICARLSSDRLVMMFRAGGPNEALLRTSRLLKGLSRPVRIQDLIIEVGLTAGLALVDDPHPAPPVERASIALDQARAAHSPVALFDAEAYGDPGSRLLLMSEMLEALESGAITLAYQPKHDTRAGRISGVEALIRWNHPVRGFVSPGMFVTLAEETGLIRVLTRWTLERALIDQKGFRKSGHDLPVSVNLSGRMLGESDFADEAIAMVQRAEGRICLEITEAAVIENPEKALGIIDRLRKAGIAISIDDYGSGPSSLAYLKRIHADELKIDKAFVMSLDRNGRDALLVKSTIDLGHSLGLRIVAEGVETAEALAILTGMGCDLAQGYFIARPMPASQLLVFLDEAEDRAKGRDEASRKAAG
jgi:EAL domain-containing protein (putative c-di-GMP-specific phosphodiesterase class I)/GGDEF domain-containing protein